MNELYPHESAFRKINQAINQLIRGRGNNTDSVTLTASVASTTVTPVKGLMNENAKIFFTPKTANAAAEQAAGTMYVSGITRADFTITHANNAQSDRTFDYVIIGG